MSWHFLQAGAVASWPENSLDGAPDALLKLMPEQGKSYSTDSVTALSNNSRYGMTSEHSTVNNGAEKSTSLQPDFHAKTFQFAGKALESKASDPVYGLKQRESFARYDLESHSWKTRQCSLFEDLSESLQTWPEWGCMQDGECFELPALERPIIDPGFTFLLTPTANSWKAWTFRSPLSLIRKNHADGNLQEQLMRLYQRMTTPRCQEILMMWPEGWTDSKPLEMDGFLSWLQEHSLRSQGCDDIINRPDN
jgi:hypothetical protein